MFVLYDSKKKSHSQTTTTTTQVPKIQDGDDAIPFVSESSESIGVSFRDVNFSYPGGRQVLDNLSFDVEPGSKVAIVGPSGCGKSTILRLLFRFFEPDTGSISFDGHDVNDLTIQSVRDHIAVVPQDTVRSIFMNRALQKRNNQNHDTGTLQQHSFL